VDGARVLLDGQSRGTTPLARKLRVPAPRKYELELTKKGWLPFSARLDVVPDATVEVDAKLGEEAAPLSWYKRWYVWAIVGALAVGAGAGAVVYLTRPDNMHDRGVVVIPMSMP
jgi:hypothetical protein